LEEVGRQHFAACWHWREVKVEVDGWNEGREAAAAIKSN
jgi:hypothetical protein